MGYPQVYPRLKVLNFKSDLTAFCSNHQIKASPTHLEASLVAQRVKKSTCNMKDPGSNPRSERSLEEGNGNPLQHACLENPMDRGAWWATVHGVTKSRIQLSDKHFDFSSHLIQWQGHIICVWTYEWKWQLITLNLQCWTSTGFLNLLLSIFLIFQVLSRIICYPNF